MRGKVPGSILGESEDTVSFIMAMNSIGQRMFGEVMAGLKAAELLPASRDARILDVGGASGTYTQAFLKELPEARATIFDLPVGIKAARGGLAGNPIASRIDLVAGDFMAGDLPSGFDFVWLSAIIRQPGREEARMPCENALSALKPGGTIAIGDFVMDQARISPVRGALFGINLLVNTPPCEKPDAEAPGCISLPARRCWGKQGTRLLIAARGQETLTRKSLRLRLAPKPQHCLPARPKKSGLIQSGICHGR